MKKLLMAFLMLTSAVTYADTTVSCQGSEPVYKNTFTLEGITYSDDDGITIGVLEFSTKTAGNESITTDYVVNPRGFTTIHPIGKFANHKVTQTQFVKVTDEIIHINLVMDMPGEFTSSIRMKDGTTFQSKCMIK